MNYGGRDEFKTLIVFPNAAEAIIKHRLDKGLPAVEVKELGYGNDEVAEIANLLHARLLSGRKATLHGFLDMLAEGWDVIWLITHGEEEGWYLSDGIVSVSETTTMIRSSGIFLTVMNTCSSEKVAREAARELGTAFICTVREVPDRQAFITGVIFAQKLAAGLDYVTAFEKARPGQDSTYVLIEARRGMTLDRPERPERPERLDRERYPSRGTMPDAETLIRFIRSVEDLDAIVNGSPRLGLPALKDVVKSLAEDIAEIKATLISIQDKQRIRTWMLWSMLIAIVLLLITVAVLGSQIGGL